MRNTEPSSFIETKGWEDSGVLRSEELLSPQLSARWKRLGSVLLAGLLVGAIVLLVGTTDKGSNWVAAGTIVLATLLVLLRRFDWCILTFLLVAWLNIGSPEVAKGGSGGGQRLLLSQLGMLGLLAAWSAKQLFSSHLSNSSRLNQSNHLSLFRHPLFIPSLLYVLLGAWSTAHNYLYPDEKAIRASGEALFYQVNILEVLLRILILGGVFMLLQSLQGKTCKRAMVLLALPGIIMFSLMLVFKNATWVETLIEKRYVAFPEIVSLALLTLWGLGKDTKLWLRITSWVIGLGILKVILIDQLEWVSGWAAMFIALIFIVWHLQRKLIWIGVFLAIVLALFNWKMVYEKIYTENFYVKAGQGYYGSTSRSLGHEAGTFENDRTRMWTAAFRYADEFPLGIGLGNYRTYNNYYGRPNVWNTTRFTSAHSTYAQALSETGWMGLLSLLYLLGTCMRVLYLYWKNLSATTHPQEKNFLLATIGVCLGMFTMSFIGDYIFPTYHNGALRTFGEVLYVWFMVGIALAIGRNCGLEAALFGSKYGKKEETIIAPYWGHPIDFPAHEIQKLKEKEGRSHD